MPCCALPPCAPPPTPPLQIAKHVQAWQPPTDPTSSKSILLRPLALQLYSRRPLLYLRGHPEPLPASVLLRSSRKPSLASISRGVGQSSLFKAPDNSIVVIKFDPRFGFAGKQQAEGGGLGWDVLRWIIRSAVQDASSMRQTPKQ